MLFYVHRERIRRSQRNPRDRDNRRTKDSLKSHCSYDKEKTRSQIQRLATPTGDSRILGLALGIDVPSSNESTCKR